MEEKVSVTALVDQFFDGGYFNPRFLTRWVLPLTPSKTTLAAFVIIRHRIDYVLRKSRILQFFGEFVVHNPLDCTSSMECAIKYSPPCWTHICANLCWCSDRLPSSRLTSMPMN